MLLVVCCCRFGLRCFGLRCWCLLLFVVVCGWCLLAVFVQKSNGWVKLFVACCLLGVCVLFCVV